MIDRVLDTIKKHKLIENGDRIVVGVSGGPDSVCLLHLLHSLRGTLEIELLAVHVNHMLRGEESEQDERYVAGLCEKLGISLFKRSYNIKAMSGEMGVSIEEAAREARYRMFDEIADAAGAAGIAVAHNKNDQAETVLMHMIRGTGLDGLKGMEYKRGRIIRPLLDVDRSAIEDYCRENGLAPRVDSSNLESIYTRNKVRLDLVPYIDSLFGTGIIDKVYSMAALIRDDAVFLEESARIFFNHCMAMKEAGGIWLDLGKLAGLPASMKKRVLRKAIFEIKGNLKGIESIHIDDAIALGEKGRSGAEIHLPCKIRILKSYDRLGILNHTKKEDLPEFCEPIAIPGVTHVAARGFLVEAFIENTRLNIVEIKNMGYNSLVQFFDYDRIKTGINIRNRREGDIFRPYKSNGTKKLKEYFIDHKIPRHVRDELPLIAKNNEVIWIVGNKISDKFKVTENTKNILKLEFKKHTG